MEVAAMAKTTRRRLTDEERAQRREQDRRRLDEAARQLLSSEGWQHWVKVRSRNGLGRYSWRNQLLIALQAPDARFVAGFHTWRDFGRRVSKGAKAIRILAKRALSHLMRLRSVNAGLHRGGSTSAGIQWQRRGMSSRAQRASERRGVALQSVAVSGGLGDDVEEPAAAA
jgi:hypothetical protein